MLLGVRSVGERGIICMDAAGTITRLASLVFFTGGNVACMREDPTAGARGATPHACTLTRAERAEEGRLV